MPRQLFHTQWWLLPSLLVFRCVNALVVQTYFDPDEYWQSLEVAHRLVFGYGYLTWEWRAGLRGYAHPLIFAAVYKGLAVCGWDSPEAVRIAPRLLQGAFAAVGDWFLYKLTARVFSPKAARLALACQLLNWFTFYCLVRSFSNCLETILITAALSYWPLPIEPIHTHHISTAKPDTDLAVNRASKAEGSATKKALLRQAETNTSSENERHFGASQWGNVLEDRVGRQDSLRQAEGNSLLNSGRENEGRSSDGENRPLALFLAGLGCFLRPTGAVLWTFLGVRELIRTREKCLLVFREAVPVGVLCLGAWLLLDRWMYGKWTVAPINFVLFNLGGGADLYGTHPWHWYFTGGLPAMATTILPFAALGVWRSRSRVLAYLILWDLGVYSSLLGHREFRFILPVLPLVMAFAGHGLATLDPEGDQALFAPINLTHSVPAPDHGKGTRTEQSSRGTEPDEGFAPALSGAADRQAPSTVTRRKTAGGAQTSADVTESSADVANPPRAKHSAGATQHRTSADVTPLPNRTLADVGAPPRAKPRATRKPFSKTLRYALFFLAITQIPMALYFSLVHQRGAVRAAEYLAGEAQRGRVSGVWFLMPCHATPFYSHVHAPVPMRILDCSPSFEPSYVSEDVGFHRDPAAFLAHEFESLHDQRTGKQDPDVVGRKNATWRQLIGSAAEGLDDRFPSHVILFDSVEEPVEKILLEHGYVRGPRFFHSHFAVDRELQGHVVVYLLTSE